MTKEINLPLEYYLFQLDFKKNLFEIDDSIQNKFEYSYLIMARKYIRKNKKRCLSFLDKVKFTNLYEHRYGVEYRRFFEFDVDFRLVQFLYWKHQQIEKRNALLIESLIEMSPNRRS